MVVPHFRVSRSMLWLLILLTSHSSLAAADNVAKASAPSEPQRHDLPADTTARDAATKPPRDSAGPGATMTRWFEALRSEALVSEAVPAGRALSEVCGACVKNYALSRCSQLLRWSSLYLRLLDQHIQLGLLRLQLPR